MDDGRQFNIDEADGVSRRDNPFRSNSGLGAPDAPPKDVKTTLERRRKIVPWVFSRNGQPISKRASCCAFKRAAAKIGQPDLRSHDYRRGAARDLVEGGAPDRWAMEVTGHRTRSMFDRYNIVDSR